MKIIPVLNSSYSQKHTCTIQPTGIKACPYPSFKGCDTHYTYNDFFLLENQATKSIDKVAKIYKNKIDIVFADIDGTLSITNNEVSKNNIDAAKN